MTVLHVMPDVSRAFGGPTESLIGYSRAAQTQNIEVHVAAPAVSPKDANWLRSALPDASFHFFSSVGRHAWVMAPGLWIWLWQHAGQFDAIHIHGLFNPVSSLSARISVMQHRPTVMRPFGTLSRYTFSRRSVLKQLYFRLLDRPALRGTTGIHFTTVAEQQEADRFSLPLEERSHIVPPPWRGNAPTVAFDEKADRPTVLYMSRLHPKKNVKGLISAWRHVVDERPEAQLWVAGDGNEAYVQSLHETVRHHNLEGSVSFLGFVSGKEKERVLHDAWAFALPSHQENFGVAVLEAVAAGLPVVISEEVQLRSFVDEHDLGAVVDRTNTKHIAEGLLQTLENDRRRAIADRGPNAVAETFSIEEVGRQLRRMYEDVIDAHA